MTYWSGYDSHIRVGIDWSISPANPSHSDTTVKVTWKYYVDTDGYLFNDDEVLHEDCTNWGGTNDSFHNGSSGGAILVGTHAENYSISTNSGQVHASCSLSGAYNGATPSRSVDVNLPNRPAAPPASINPPSAGENPAASSITPTTVHINWGYPTNDGGEAPTDFQLEVDTNSGYSSPNVNVFTGGIYSHDCTGLTPNTKYYIRVRALNSAGYGTWTTNDSESNTFTTASGAPNNPGTPGMTDRTKTSIQIGWGNANSNGGGLVTYYIHYGTDPTLQSYTVASTTALSVNLTGLTPNTIYYFNVYASNGGGTSGTTSIQTGTTLPNLTYNDSGDLVTLVSNLANAVGDKLTHLGTFLFRGRTGGLTLAHGYTYFDMNVQLEYCTQPNPPIYSGGADNANLTIEYPGTYMVEFASAFPSIADNDIEMSIFINGDDTPSSTNPRKGISEAVTGSTHALARHVFLVRHLDIGDTVGFATYNYSSSSLVQPVISGSDLHCWTRVTMIGF